MKKNSNQILNFCQPEADVDMCYSNEGIACMF